MIITKNELLEKTDKKETKGTPTLDNPKSVSTSDNDGSTFFFNASTIF